MGRKKKQEPSRNLNISGPVPTMVYAWYRNTDILEPYKEGEIIQANPLEITQEFLARGMGVALRPTYLEVEPGKDVLGCLVMVSDSGAFQQR